MPEKRKRRTSEEVRQAAVAKELLAIRQRLGEVAGMQRFLLASRLVQLGHAKGLREAVAIIKDKDRLAAVFEATDARER